MHISSRRRQILTHRHKFFPTWAVAPNIAGLYNPFIQIPSSASSASGGTVVVNNGFELVSAGGNTYNAEFYGDIANLTGQNHTFGAQFGGDVSVGGDLKVAGNMTREDWLTTSDTTLCVNYNTTTDSQNSGLLNAYKTGGAIKYAGVIRKAGGGYALTKDEVSDNESLLTFPAYDTLRLGGLVSPSGYALTLPDSAAATLLSTLGSSALTGALSDASGLLTTDYVNSKLMCKNSNGYALFQGGQTTLGAADEVRGIVFQVNPAVKDGTHGVGYVMHLTGTASASTAPTLKLGYFVNPNANADG